MSITGINRLQGRAYRSLGLLLSLLLLRRKRVSGVRRSYLMIFGIWPHCRDVSFRNRNLGSIDGPDHLVFYQVEDAQRLPDGRIAVLNRGSQEVRCSGLMDAIYAPRAPWRRIPSRWRCWVTTRSWFGDWGRQSLCFANLIPLPVWSRTPGRP